MHGILYKSLVRQSSYCRPRVHGMRLRGSIVTNLRTYIGQPRLGMLTIGIGIVRADPSNVNPVGHKGFLLDCNSPIITSLHNAVRSASGE